MAAVSSCPGAVHAISDPRGARGAGRCWLGCPAGVAATRQQLRRCKQGADGELAGPLAYLWLACISGDAQGSLSMVVRSSSFAAWSEALLICCCRHAAVTAHCGWHLACRPVHFHTSTAQHNTTGFSSAACQSWRSLKAFQEGQLKKHWRCRLPVLRHAGRCPAIMACQHPALLLAPVGILLAAVELITI